MRLTIELPHFSVSAGATLYPRAAPNVVPFVWDALENPLETQTSHACFDGHEVYCFLECEGQAPDAENMTIRPRPGDIVYFFAPAGKFAAVNADQRLGGATPDVHELAFMYDEVDLRHYWEEGWVGSVIGHVDVGLDGFAAACRRTLNEGRTTIRISRAVEAAPDDASRR